MLPLGGRLGRSALRGELAPEGRYHIACDQLTQGGLDTAVAGMRDDSAGLRRALGELISPGPRGRPAQDVRAEDFSAPAKAATREYKQAASKQRPRRTARTRP